MRKRTITNTGRLAIRVNATTLLAVPPMHPNTPSSVRVKVFEYVLRGQVGLAQMTADIAADSLGGGVEGAQARLAHLISETPYRGSAMAA